MTLAIFHRKRRGKTIAIRPRLSIMTAMVLVGVRGLVTLADILTPPVLLADGSPFPGRELLTFLLMAVILMSLIVATVGLSYMTQCLADDLPRDTGRDNIGAVMTEVVIDRLNVLLGELMDNPNEQALRVDAGSMLLETYQRRLHYNDGDEGQDVGLELARCTRLKRYMQREIIIAQRRELLRLRCARNIGDTTFYEVLWKIDLKEESLR